MTQRGKLDVPGGAIYTFTLYFIIYVGIRSIIPLKIIYNDNDLNWICNQMTYHMFPKLGEIIQGYLVRNQRKGLAPKDFFNIKCNCKPTT